MRKNKIARLIGAGGAAGLGVLVFILLSCPNLTSANAVEYFVNESDAAVQSENAGQITKVYVKPSISIALANAMEITADKEFNSNITDIKVATNSERGFKVLVNAATNTNLVETADSSKVIPTIATAATAADFPNAGWGYYVDELEPLDSSKYLPVSTTATVAKSTSTSGASNTLKLSVGVKAGPEVSVGTYQNTLIVSAIANPIAISTLYGLTYMQEMTPEICAATKNYVSTSDYAWKTLIDTRVNNDGTRQSYRVAKLADGNCWMQENLKLDLNSSVNLTSANTDLATNRVWKPTNSTWTTTGHGSSNSSGTESYNFKATNGSTLDYGFQWYYQWHAVTAGTEGADNICPKGWQAPTSGGGNGSYGYLLGKYGVSNYSTMVSTGAAEPLNFFGVGYATSGSVAGVSQSYGYYWTRTGSGSSAYRLYWASSGSISFDLANPHYTYEAYPVRCIARTVAR